MKMNLINKVIWFDDIGYGLKIEWDKTTNVLCLYAENRELYWSVTNKEQAKEKLDWYIERQIKYDQSDFPMDIAQVIAWLNLYIRS